MIHYVDFISLLYMDINVFLRMAINKAMTTTNHAHMYSVQGESSVYVNWTKHVFKRDLFNDSDGAHQTSFGIEFLTEEEAKENERSPSVALLCAGLLRRGMVYELERVLPVCDSFYAACQRHMMVQYCCGSGSTKKLFCKCFFS